MPSCGLLYQLHKSLEVKGHFIDGEPEFNIKDIFEPLRWFKRVPDAVYLAVYLK